MCVNSPYRRHIEMTSVMIQASFCDALMPAYTVQRDITGTVNLEDATAVAAACVAILQARYGTDAIDAPLIAQAFCANPRRHMCMARP